MDLIQKRLGKFPAVALLGPRQCGKTTLAAVGKGPQASFFRTFDGHELDLVLDWGTRRWAIEVKLTSDPSTEMLNRLNHTADMIDASQRVLVCRTARTIENDAMLVIDPCGWLKRLIADPS